MTREVLQQEWKAQVAAQLVKPPRTWIAYDASAWLIQTLAGQNANAADKVINELLLAMGGLQELRQDVKDERARLKKVHAMTSSEVTAVTSRVEALKYDIGVTEASISNMQASLGPTATKKWMSMRGDAYLRARVNARAMRATIRSTLVSYKFERRKVERTFRHQLMRKLQACAST